MGKATAPRQRLLLPGRPPLEVPAFAPTFPAPAVAQGLGGLDPPQGSPSRPAVRHGPSPSHGPGAQLDPLPFEGASAWAGTTPLTKAPAPLIALVEASLTGGERLGAALVGAILNAGGRPAALCLEHRNRLATLLSPSPDLLLHLAPQSESLLSPAEVADQLALLQGRSDGIVVDLGCRWAPRLFRTVMERATEIWIIGRVGQWSALEARLQQAEISGWTDLARVRLLVMGESGPAPPPVLHTEPPILLPDDPVAMGQLAQSTWRRLSP
jgi:hypothetical protein